MNDRTNLRSGEGEAGTFERMGEQLGGAAGRVVERGSEMAGGMLGSMMDSVANTLGEWWSSADADRAARSFTDEKESDCRRHFEGQGASGAARGYDDVRPLYQFGHMASENPEFRGRDFNQVEDDLERAWGSDTGRAPADWSEVRGYVGFGYSGDNPESPRDR